MISRIMTTLGIIAGAVLAAAGIVLAVVTKAGFTPTYYELTRVGFIMIIVCGIVKLCIRSSNKA